MITANLLLSYCVTAQYPLLRNFLYVKLMRGSVNYNSCDENITPTSRFNKIAFVCLNN
jgi:hypothetical protein